MKTEVYDTPEAFLAALAGKPRTKRGRSTRPDLPAAGRAAATGLTTLIAGKARAWSVAFEVGRGFRLYVINDPTRDTGWQVDELAACQKAKEL
jgi:hypothetical protein